MNNGTDNAYARLIQQLKGLPGIGEKTATRLALFIMRSEGHYALELAQAIQEAKSRVGFCKNCQDFTEDELCRICNNPERDQNSLCIVEDPASMYAIEETGKFQGRYHILHGNLSPNQAIGPEALQLDRVKTRLRNETHIDEVILALNCDPEGEATSLYLREYLNDLPIRITRIGSGLPVGGHVQYTDPMTLSRALSSRYELGGS